MRIFLLLFLCAGLAGADPRLADCAWLSGNWTGEQGQLEERWLAPAGNSMMGMCRIVDGERTVHKEFLALEQDAQGVVWLSLILARDPLKVMKFRATETTPTGLTFVGTGEQSQERMTYRQRTPDEVVITIEKVPPAQTLQFELHRASQ